MDKNSKICVIYGGMSAEREVSLKSGKNMADALLKNFPNVSHCKTVLKCCHINYGTFLF